MSRHALSAFALLALASSAAAQSGTAAAAVPTVTPLVDHKYTYPNLPYQVDPSNGVRGPQQGFNICNSTTETQTSMCQTMFVDSIDDFCVWGPPKFNSSIGDTEGETVAWCSKPGHGTRVIPNGALQGVQFLRAPAYLQVTGILDQTQIDMTVDDGGGELDPHGADLRGNPLGGLVFSNGFPSNNGNNGTYQQVIEWHNFMGSDMFCIKVCDPSVSDSTKYCQNIFDRIGCQYNAPASYTNGTFLTCDSDNQDPPGIYTDASGAIQTFTQPAESLGPISSMPYTAKIPATSNCVTFQSADLYKAAATVSGVQATNTASSASGSATGTAKTSSATGKSASVSGSKSGSASAGGASSTNSANSGFATRGNVGSGAGLLIAVGVSVMAGLGALVVAL